MATHGTLKIWVAINTLNGRESYQTLETVCEIREETARQLFAEWKRLNPHFPKACAKWVPTVVHLV